MKQELGKWDMAAKSKDIVDCQLHETHRADSAEIKCDTQGLSKDLIIVLLCWLDLLCNECLSQNISRNFVLMKSESLHNRIAPRDNIQTV